jgi:hypothetical protein
MDIVLPIIIWGGIIVGVIYYSIKRYRDYKNETFEDRDN